MEEKNNGKHPMLMKYNYENKETIYNRNSANPFLATGGSKLWKRSELILKDKNLRAKAGVSQLDASVTRGYEANPEKIDK